MWGEGRGEQSRPYLEEIGRLPGPQAADELQQGGGVGEGDALVDVHAHLVDSVDKLQVQRAQKLFLGHLVLPPGGEREQVSGNLKSTDLSMERGINIIIKMLWNKFAYYNSRRWRGEGGICGKLFAKVRGL